MENITPLTWTATTEKGNEYEVIAYSDPYPGRKGSERIKETCGWCGGSGIYEGPSGYKFQTPAAGNAVTTGCFHCDGRGYNSILVSSARASAKRRVKARNARAAELADSADQRAAEREAEFLADWDAALAEQARRDAKSKVHMGSVGERLRGINARVEMVRHYESRNFVTGGPELKAVVKFTTTAGAVLVWFTGSTGLHEGDFVNLSGTVKDHNTRDGEAQTILTRCSVK